MNITSEEQHVALPKLYGAPAYARPPKIVDEKTPRPFDPDELPLAVAQTEEERSLAELLEQAAASGVTPAFASNGHRRNGRANRSDGRPMLLGRPFRLRALASRLLRGGE
ncbi:MAG: hypothetical protein E6H96_05795 [Chloroflexi bacterium]|nr:MAG: hypothetical protein E6H96_05795 [Chloroflexota bacterium]